MVNHYMDNRGLSIMISSMVNDYMDNRGPCLVKIIRNRMADGMRTLC